MDQLKPPGNLDFESPDLAYAWKKWREETNNNNNNNNFINFPTMDFQS